MMALRQTYGSSTWIYIAAAITTSYNDTTAKYGVTYDYMVPVFIV